MATVNSIGSHKPVEVGFGGTGSATETAYAVVCGGTTNTNPLQSVASLGTSGQVLTSAGAASLPTWTTISSTSGGGYLWATQGISVGAVAGRGYIINGGGLVTLTLPAISATGDSFRVVDFGGNGWSIAQNAGNFIQISASITSVGVGGSLTSTVVGDEVTVVCVGANTSWVAVDIVGNITVV